MKANNAYLIKGWLLGVPNVPTEITMAINALIAEIDSTEAARVFQQYAGSTPHEVNAILESSKRKDTSNNKLRATDLGAEAQPHDGEERRGKTDDEKVAEHLEAKGVTTKKERKKYNISDEQRAAAAERMRKWQAEKKLKKGVASESVDAELAAAAKKNSEEHKGSMLHVPEKDVIEMLLNNWTPLAIGKKYGCNDKSVNIYCTRKRIDRHNRPALRHRLEQLTRPQSSSDDLIENHSGFADLREDGLLKLTDLPDIEQQLRTDSIDDVATRYGVTSAEIQVFLNKHSAMKIQRIKPVSETLDPRKHLPSRRVSTF